MQDVALEDQWKSIKRARSLERKGRISFDPNSAPTYPQFFPPSFLRVSIRRDGFLRWNVFFFSPLHPDVRLERELIYDSQFDERLRGRKKRSFFSENEHQRLGEKKKVRERKGR